MKEGNCGGDMVGKGGGDGKVEEEKAVQRRGLGKARSSHGGEEVRTWMGRLRR